MKRKLARSGLIGVALFALAAGTFADRAPAQSPAAMTLHYAPSENLERIDVETIRSAQSRIDMAAYILTDQPVITALIDAAARGVEVRIVIDPTHATYPLALQRLAPIAAHVRRKTVSPPILHLKAYAVDGRVLRTGSANFMASALKQQDNDLLLIRDAAFIADYQKQFERIWSAATPIR